MLKHLIGSFIACLGFCILFNQDFKKIIPTCLNCVIGIFVYEILLIFNISENFALMASSFVISMGSEILARKLKAPALVFLVAPLIPLVPGGAAYKTILFMFEKQMDKALDWGINTLLMAGSIVIGVSLASSIIKIITDRKRKENEKR